MLDCLSWFKNAGSFFNCNVWVIVASVMLFIFELFRQNNRFKIAIVFERLPTHVSSYRSHASLTWKACKTHQRTRSVQRIDLDIPLSCSSLTKESKLEREAADSLTWWWFATRRTRTQEDKMMRMSDEKRVANKQEGLDKQREKWQI